MRGYETNEYEDWDEYEEDGEEEEEEEGAEDGYEEPEQPSREALEYLELRQRLKETIRKQRQKEQGTANACPRDKTNTYRKDNYGSFFGPSQPVIAQRVIEESKSLLENPNLAARISRPNHTVNNKSRISAPVRPKSQPSYRPSATNGIKRKVEIIRDARDYSFLLSEDAEVPAPSKTPPPRNVSTPKSGNSYRFFAGLEKDARPSAQPQQRSKQAANERGREVSNGRDVRKPMPSNSQSKARVGQEKTGPARKLPEEQRRQLASNTGSGPGRPQMPKNVPSKSQVPPTGKPSTAVVKNTVNRVHKPTASHMQSAVRKPTASSMPSGGHKSTPSGQTSVMRRPLGQKEYQESRKPNVVTKQTLPSSSRDQLKRPVPKPPVRGGSLPDQRPKAKPKRQLRDEDSDGENAINMIRQMFGYNPNKFRDDDDVSDMEANFEDIQREEKRSAKIARKEDEEQLRLIEEEERRERMRAAKKRKMGH